MIDFTQDVLNPDVNGDGSYNVLDIIALADCILMQIVRIKVTIMVM